MNLTILTAEIGAWSWIFHETNRHALAASWSCDAFMSTMLRILHILKHWNMIPYIDLLMNIIVLFLNKSPTYQGSWLWDKKAGADTAPPRTLPATTPPPSLASRCWPHSAWSWCNPPWHPHGDLSRAWELYWHFVAEIVVYQSCVSSRVVNISLMLLHTKVTCDWLRLEQSKLGWCRERRHNRAASLWSKPGPTATSAWRAWPVPTACLSPLPVRT